MWFIILNMESVMLWSHWSIFQLQSMRCKAIVAQADIVWLLTDCNVITEFGTLMRYITDKCNVITVRHYFVTCYTQHCIQYSIYYISNLSFLRKSHFPTTTTSISGIKLYFGHFSVWILTPSQHWVGSCQGFKWHSLNNWLWKNLF